MENKNKIISEWKSGYTKAILEALAPKGDFLQIGFGAGLTQKYPVKSHVIIEHHPSRLLAAKKWAASHPHVKVIEGSWETLLPTLGAFDVIFFNDYPDEQEIYIMNFLFPKDAAQFTKEAKKMIELLAERMAKCKTPFSDQEIEELYQARGRYFPKEFPAFLKKLKENGNITQAQVKKYSKKEKEQTVEKTDPLLHCLKKCLKGHLKKGGRFTAFLNDQLSRFNDAQFFDEIITNADLDYQEDKTPVKLSDRTIDALVMMVTLV